MWGSRESDTVTCIACGRSVDRSDAREYDKEGDRWERRDKEFEHVCKQCHRELCHQPRDELERLLVDIDAGSLGRGEFLHRYVGAVEERYGHEPGSDRK
jgi:hypothetical protein